MFNEFTVQNSFAFGEEILNQGSKLFMGSLNVDSFFTNIPLKETINIGASLLNNNEDVIEGIKKSNLLSLATQESCLIFNDVLYKQKDGMAMGLHHGPTMTKVFLSFYEVKWLEQCLKKFKPVFYRIFFVVDIFVLFELAEHLLKFCDYFNTCHPNMSFSFLQEKDGKLSFLDIEESLEKRKICNKCSWKPYFQWCVHPF